MAIRGLSKGVLFSSDPRHQRPRGGRISLWLYAGAVITGRVFGIRSRSQKSPFFDPGFASFPAFFAVNETQK
jgi:hypothetical protein